MIVTAVGGDHDTTAETQDLATEDKTTLSPPLRIVQGGSAIWTQGRGGQDQIHTQTETQGQGD